MATTQDSVALIRAGRSAPHGGGTVETAREDGDGQQAGASVRAGRRAAAHCLGAGRRRRVQEPGARDGRRSLVSRPQVSRQWVAGVRARVDTGGPPLPARS